MILVELSLNNYLIWSDHLINPAMLTWQDLDIGSILAQSVRDTNVLGQMVDMWNTFIRSGQVWALLIGFVLGYLLRGITA
ncbi:hypothetical protein C7B64_18395 [Merismopedia glauca CCAP 1448/3]|uniref:Uncharacterized protein n=2 Tax=Merismopedia TaxID=53402 RepID=A0A2T1BZU1_9CYAN|nr:hypothetical protein C7B64_18395 [Merismopedia glauca CCAP 1448/3]